MHGLAPTRREERCEGHPGHELRQGSRQSRGQMTTKTKAIHSFPLTVTEVTVVLQALVIVLIDLETDASQEGRYRREGVQGEGRSGTEGGDGGLEEASHNHGPRVNPG